MHGLMHALIHALMHALICAVMHALKNRGILMKKQSEDKKYIQSVERALSMMIYIADHGSARLGEISSAAGLRPSTASGLLQTLEHMGFLSRSKNELDYCLGLSSLKLGLCFNKTSGLASHIHALLTDLVKEVDETAYFEIKIGDRYYYYDVVLSTQPLKVVPTNDHFIDLPDSSAVAKAFREELGDLGFATDLEEIEPGLNCFAVPIRSGSFIVGCVALTGPSCRFTLERMKKAYAVFCRLMKQSGMEY